jgi:hypothetical protein
MTDGPNQLWCLDGHDKLSQYGIQIYPAVDAYSRKILWMYCGTAKRDYSTRLYTYAKLWSISWSRISTSAMTLFPRGWQDTSPLMYEPLPV